MNGPYFSARAMSSCTAPGTVAGMNLSVAALFTSEYPTSQVSEGAAASATDEKRSIPAIMSVRRETLCMGILSIVGGDVFVFHSGGR